MPKAVKITSANKNELEQRFGIVDNQREPLVPGYFFIADFGNGDDEVGANYEQLTWESLKTHFQVTGKKLKNGFFEVVRL